ncbi:MAG: VapC toxin family PIN domain ribonuclease [Pusillimonas sp.]|nr:VapC toxin family PIN domain ribonuclease [Pusillimonas sp.]
MNGVLVDTSVWVDHFRRKNQALTYMLERDCVLVHPMIIGELACGTPPDRARTLVDLDNLQHAQQASLAETLNFIEREELWGLGCGLIDILLLASTLMTPNAEIWTLDKRLSTLAKRFGVMHQALKH